MWVKGAFYYTFNWTIYVVDLLLVLSSLHLFLSETYHPQENQSIFHNKSFNKKTSVKELLTLTFFFKKTIDKIKQKQN